VAYKFHAGEAQDTATHGGQPTVQLLDVIPLCRQLNVSEPHQWKDRGGLVRARLAVQQRRQGKQLHITHKARLLVQPWRVVKWLESLRWGKLVGALDGQLAAQANQALFGLQEHCRALVAGSQELAWHPAAPSNRYTSFPRSP